MWDQCSSNITAHVLMRHLMSRVTPTVGAQKVGRKPHDGLGSSLLSSVAKNSEASGWRCQITVVTEGCMLAYETVF